MPASTLASPAKKQARLILPNAVALIAIVFGVDMYTPLGTVEWVMYLAPVAICMFARRPRTPLVAALACTLLMVAGLFLSPPGIAPEAAALNRMIGAVALWIVAGVAFFLIRARIEVQRLAWLQTGAARMAQETLGDATPESLGNRLLRTLVEYVGGDVAALYLLTEDQHLERLAAWGQLPDQSSARLPAGAAGLPGQAAAEQRVVTLLDPDGRLRIGATVAQGTPASVIAAPLTAENRVVAVVELGFLHNERLDDVRELLRSSAEFNGMAIRSALYRRRLEELLRETRRQSAELQAQQEELRVSNEELEEQTRLLRDSQARLELQQSELEQTNVQLEEQSHNLESQKQALLEAQARLTANAQALQRANQYKSEFLANMSHELRTPLNSSLILSKLLSDNKPGNLTGEQVRYALTIQQSNNELLTLINDILDLSKVEAGRIDLNAGEIGLDALLEALDRSFRPQAEQKHLRLRLERAPGAPETIVSDMQRLQQILKNLLSNALKFTEHGEVSLRIAAVDDARVAFEISDTGIGIAAEQQDVIFEAFRQADGTTSRKYGGTGLGLSISRELAALLGGTLNVRSEPGRGSTFTLQLPLVFVHNAAPAARPEPPRTPPPVAARSPAPVAPAMPADDDRHRRRRDRLILIVEDEAQFASLLKDIVHEADFDAAIGASAAEALQLAAELKPCAILLDTVLPDGSGLSVLERLKREPATRHIPVHMISGFDYADAALPMGAVGYTMKPTSRETLLEILAQLRGRMNRSLRRVLIVEDDAQLRETMSMLLGGEEVKIVGAGTIAEAMQQLQASAFDCVVMDLMLPDGSGHELLKRMAEFGRGALPPVIVYTGRTISADEEQTLRRYSKSIIVKGARSPERLLDEVTLFLHSVEAELPPERQRMLRAARERDGAFEGRRILLAEDDVRNIFALSQVLEPLGAQLEIARNGREAVSMATARRPDLVLMDIMMPEMDGITAIRELRKQSSLRDLSIIALTAKAMAEDRERCIEAGANDYIAKPIDIDKMLSLCRVWLPH